MMSFCNQCGQYHESVTVCHGLRVFNEPLPPTAEQTSIARFNALADQIRDLGTTLNCMINALGRIEHYVEQSSLKMDRLIFDEKIGYDAVMRMLAKPNVAVAKKKAAPLVGKKGTGRKG